MSVTSALKFARTEKHTSLFLIRSDKGIWAANPPNWFIPLELIMELTGNIKEINPLSRKFQSQFNSSRIGMYNLEDMHIEYVREMSGSLSFLDSGHFLKPNTKPIITRDICQFGTDKLVVKISETRRNFIVADNDDIQYYYSPDKDKMIIKSSGIPIGALRAYAYRPNVHKCVICGTNATQQTYSPKYGNYWTCSMDHCQKTALEKAYENGVSNKTMK